MYGILFRENLSVQINANVAKFKKRLTELTNYFLIILLASYIISYATHHYLTL